MVRPLALLLLLSACGADENARMVTTMYTQTCDWSGQNWLGVERLTVAVEYAPAALPERELPAVGTCTTDARLFMEESALPGGAPIPNVSGDPLWRAVQEDGALMVETPGLYFDEATPAGGCLTADEMAADGVALEQAGVLDGAASPAPSDAGMVFLDGKRDKQWAGTLEFGTPIDLSWSAAGWDESFVQIRQANGNNVSEVLTCNTTGLEAFALDASVWAQTTNMGTSTLEIYVGLRNRGAASGKGEELEAMTQVVQVISQD